MKKELALESIGIGVMNLLTIQKNRYEEGITGLKNLAVPFFSAAHIPIEKSSGIPAHLMKGLLTDPIK